MKLRPSGALSWALRIAPVFPPLKRSRSPTLRLYSKAGRRQGRCPVRPPADTRGRKTGARRDARGQEPRTKVGTAPRRAARTPAAEDARRRSAAAAEPFGFTVDPRGITHVLSGSGNTYL